MDTLQTERINKARADFIKDMRQKHGGSKVMKYRGQMEEGEMPEDCLSFHRSRLKGTELVVEFHKFEVAKGPKKGMLVLGQWRLLPD